MNYFVTGISRGLGYAVAKKLLEADHVVYGISRNSSAELNLLLRQYTTQLKWISVDLTARNDKLPSIIFKNFINNRVPLHGFVSNAAMAYDDIVTNINAEALDKMYWVNTLNPMILTKYVLRNMIYNRIKGSIVHISSISVHTGYKGLAMYASTKGALEAFSKNLAREWGEMGIRSNCLVAGFMETDMSSTLTNDQKNRIYLRTSLKQATSVDSVAETICFLLSEQAKSITGQNIFVDNGTI